VERVFTLIHRVHLFILLLLLPILGPQEQTQFLLLSLQKVVVQVRAKLVTHQESQEDLAEEAEAPHPVEPGVQMHLEIQNHLKVILEDQLLTQLHIMERAVVAEQALPEAMAQAELLEPAV
tara:strand:- start:115 stop:477 length:363 start_codon:yes stop_codon:yes gene_type:complete